MSRKSGTMKIMLTAGLLTVLSACAWAIADNDWCATQVVSYQNIGLSPFDDPNSVLGRPTTWNVESAAASDVTPGNYAVSLVYAAYASSPDGAKLVLTLNKAKTGAPTQPAGNVVVKFATPIYDDPLNWYGKDFIVFGNSRFNGSDGLVDINTDMGLYHIIGTASGLWEPMKVSVSQDNVNWFDYSAGPYADDFAPTQAFAWDRVSHTWGADMDYTRPVPTSLAKTSFAGMTVADGSDLYKGSAGGTAFDISGLALPVDPATGMKWIQYVKVTSRASSTGLQADGEVDAIARVSHEIREMSIGEAKQLPDGAKVVLKECAVSAGTYEVGRYCYVEHSDRSGGIKVTGRILDRDKHYTIYGNMGTITGERVILATCVVPVLDGQQQVLSSPIAPMGMPNKSVGGQGLSTAGLLVRTWGKVKSVDPVDKSFTIDDGSGKQIKCVAPRDTSAAEPNNGVSVHPSFNPPALNSFATVTGISSLEQNAQSELVPVIRLRDLDAE